MLLTRRYWQPLVALCLLCSISTVQADEILHIEDAWVAEAPPVAPVMGGYMKIANKTDKLISITSASCPDFEKTEIHEMSMSGGMMKRQAGCTCQRQGGTAARWLSPDADQTQTNV